MSNRNSLSHALPPILAFAVITACAGLGLSSCGVRAQPAGAERAQAGAGVAFTSLKDWSLKADNLSPRGHNPLTFPLEPGFRYIVERPDHPQGHLRVEVVVLDTTEAFDVPDFGKFECAVVQEEEFLKGAYHQQTLNWVAIDKTTKAMYTFGTLRWEIDGMGRKVFAGTWRVGEADSSGIAEPGMLMPGTFAVGEKYLTAGHEPDAYRYAENVESAATLTVPAGTFKDCVRTREHDLTEPTRVTDTWWCPGIGIVKSASDGELVASDALKSDMSSIGKYHRESDQQTTASGSKVTEAQAREIALKAIPGKVTSVAVERMGKLSVYAVEIIARKDGVETDVFVDIATGKVVGTAR